MENIPTSHGQSTLSLVSYVFQPLSASVVQFVARRLLPIQIWRTAQLVPTRPEWYPALCLHYLSFPRRKWLCFVPPSALWRLPYLLVALPNKYTMDPFLPWNMYMLPLWIYQPLYRQGYFPRAWVFICLFKLLWGLKLCLYYWQTRDLFWESSTRDCTGSLTELSCKRMLFEGVWVLSVVISLIWVP